jgi:hypothetical protein
MDNPARRLVYVLTAWEERRATADRSAVWRFSLEDTCGRQRLGFKDLDELTTFLARQVDAERPGEEVEEIR